MASDLRNRLVPAGQTASIQANPQAGDDENQFVIAPLTNLVGDTSFSPSNVIDFISNADQVAAAGLALPTTYRIPTPPDRSA